MWPSPALAPELQRAVVPYLSFQEQATLGDKVWPFCLVRSHSVSWGLWALGQVFLQDWRGMWSDH